MNKIELLEGINRVQIEKREVLIILESEFVKGRGKALRIRTAAMDVVARIYLMEKSQDKEIALIAGESGDLLYFRLRMKLVDEFYQFEVLSEKPQVVEFDLLKM